MVGEPIPSRIAPILDEIRRELATIAYPLPTRQAEEGADARDDIVHQLDDYILPRYRNLDAPVLAVIGGSTGSGKSALINALVREHVARSSAVRPTTRQPMLMFNPADEHWFSDSRILPELVRVSGGQESDEPHTHLSLHTTDALPAGIALLDSPDIDSFAQENRELAAQLLAAADLWVFVTTAARYADAVPWTLLDEAAQRNIVVSVVLNRVPPGQGAQVRPDLARRLNERGLQSAPLFVISEQEFDELGFIRDGDVSSLRDWLIGLSVDSASRVAVVRQTLTGAVVQLGDTLNVVCETYDEQISAQRALQWDIDNAKEAALAAINQALDDGVVLRGEVLARWQDVIGTGTWTRALEDGVSRIRDRVVTWFTGQTGDEHQVIEALDESIQTLLATQAEASALEVRTAWQRSALIIPPQERDHEQRRAEAGELVRQWQEELYALVSTEGESKKATARFLALGVNAIGLALMITVFSATAGLAGGEIAVAGGTAVVAQRVLEAVFGDDAVRRMTKQATGSLRERAAEFISRDLKPYREMLDGLELGESHIVKIDDLRRQLRRAHGLERA